MIALKAVLLSLVLGYLLCVVANKQEKILKTLGYTIGISIMVIGILYGLMMSNCQMPGKMCAMCGKAKMMKHCAMPSPMMKR